MINTTYKVTGSAVGKPKGATLTFSKASTANLKLGEQEASLEGTFTVEMKGGNAISLTTTTP